MFPLWVRRCSLHVKEELDGVGVHGGMQRLTRGSSSLFSFFSLQCVAAFAGDAFSAEPSSGSSHSSLPRPHGIRKARRVGSTRRAPPGTSLRCDGDCTVCAVVTCLYTVNTLGQSLWSIPSRCCLVGYRIWQEWATAVLRGLWPDGWKLRTVTRGVSFHSTAQHGGRRDTNSTGGVWRFLLSRLLDARLTDALA